MRKCPPGERFSESAHSQVPGLPLPVTSVCVVQFGGVALGWQAAWVTLVKPKLPGKATTVWIRSSVCTRPILRPSLTIVTRSPALNRAASVTQQRRAVGVTVGRLLGEPERRLPEVEHLAEQHLAAGVAMRLTWTASAAPAARASASACALLMVG